MITADVPESTCVSCGKKMDASTCVSDESHHPEPGDITICFYCGEIQAFGEGLELRPLTEGEKEMVSSDPLVQSTADSVKIFQTFMKELTE